MSKINHNQILVKMFEDDSIELEFGEDVPYTYEDKIVKSFEEKGYIETLEKSTDDKRTSKEKLYECSEEEMTKDEELPYWHPKAQLAHARKLRADAKAARTTQATPATSSAATVHPTPSTKPAAAPSIPKPSPVSVYNLGDGTGRKYVNIKDKAPSVAAPKKTGFLKAEEDKEVLKWNANGQWDIKKSNYGPKGAFAYTEADNARRKADNTGSIDLGSMSRVKNYGASHPGKIAAEDRRIRRLNAKQPVKVYTPEEIKAHGNNLKKMANWSDEELSNLSKSNPLLGYDRKMPLQATDEQLFGGGVVTEEQAEAAKQAYEGVFTDFYTQVRQPVEKQDLSKSWGSRGPIDKETLTEEEERIRAIPVNPNLLERD